MKTQEYLVTIEMPDGDMIGPEWIKDIIQADCDVEDTGRHKVSVEEIKAEYICKDALMDWLIDQRDNAALIDVGQYEAYQEVIDKLESM